MSSNEHDDVANDHRTAPSSDEHDTAPGAVAMYRAVWRHRRWRWLIGSALVSLAGDLLYWVALVVFLTGQDDPALWLALSFIARLVPWVVVGPIGGAIADRFPRRRLLIGLDVARALLFLVIAAVVVADGHPAIVLLVLAAASTCSAIYRPARVAAIPQVVPESQLAAANAAEEGLAQIAWFVGPALGAVLVAMSSPGTVLVVNAATYVVSALMVARAGFLGGGRTNGDGEPSSLFADVRDGAALLARDRGLRGLAVICTAASMAFGAEQVLYVLVAADRLDLGAEGVGYILAAMGVGGVLAAPWSARVGDSPRVGWWLVGTGMLAALPMMLIGVTTSTAIVLALTAVEGGAAVIFEVVALTLIQRAVDERALGRVSSVIDAVATLGQVAGSLAAPLLVTWFGLSVALQLSGGVAAGAMLLTMPAVLLLAKTTDERRRRSRATTRFLGTAVELAPLEPIDLERLARATTERLVPAGTEVIRAGDAADDVFVVRSGSLHVAVEGSLAETVPELGPHDLFGEIGLLHGVPRTATVTATTDVELAVIDGSVFAATVLPSAETSGALMSGLSRRLGRTHPSLTEAPLVATGGGLGDRSEGS